MLFSITAFVKEFIKNAGSPLYTIITLPKMFDLGLGYVREIFKIPEFQKVWTEEEFDLLLIEGIFGDPFLGFAAHFKCPSVVLNSFEPQMPFNDLVGNSTPFSYVSSIFYGGKFPISFKDRFLNFLAHLALPITFHYTYGKMDEIYRLKFFNDYN